MAPGTLQCLDRLRQLSGVTLHAVNGLQLRGYRADRFAQILLLQDLVGNEAIDALDRLVGHEPREGTGGRDRLDIRHRFVLSAQGTVQPSQVRLLAVVTLDMALAQLFDEQGLEVGEWHDLSANRRLQNEVLLFQLDTGQHIKLGSIFACHRIVASLVQPRTHRDDGGERVCRFTFVRMENRRQVTVRRIQARVASIVTAQHIRCERTHTFTAPPSLRRFVLSRVVLKKVLMRRRHHRLNGISSRGLARAVSAREQADRPELEIDGRHVAPVDEDEALKKHRRAPRSLPHPLPGHPVAPRPALPALRR